MGDHRRIAERAIHWRGGRMALATVLSTWESAPRPRGSHLLVHESGEFEGSISGGCVEADVLGTAGKVLNDRQARIREYGVADSNAWEAGLPCGGQIRVLIQPVGDDGFPVDLFRRIVEASVHGEHFYISTDQATGRSWMGQSEGAFVNHYFPPRQMLIVGAVQIAQSLVVLCNQVNTTPVLIDPRGRFLTKERFPDGRLDPRWPDKAIPSYNPGPTTAIVTLSHKMEIDDTALCAALQSSAGYIAALGSRKNHAARRERLLARGFSEESVSRIDGPAGLAIGAIGPGEIAVSIVAAMVKAFAVLVQTDSLVGSNYAPTSQPEGSPA
jgi:xanthine dehydrogenase accessory factor